MWSMTSIAKRYISSDHVKICSRSFILSAPSLADIISKELFVSRKIHAADEDTHFQLESERLMIGTSSKKPKICDTFLLTIGNFLLRLVFFQASKRFLHRRHHRDRCVSLRLGPKKLFLSRNIPEKFIHRDFWKRTNKTIAFHCKLRGKTRRHLCINQIYNRRFSK